MFSSNQLIALGSGGQNAGSNLLVIATAQWIALSERAIHIVKTYHENFPLRRGIPREELKSRLEISAQLFSAMLKKMDQAESLIQTGKRVAMPGVEINFDKGQQSQVEALMRRFAQNPYTPPTIKDSRSEVGDEIFNALIDMGDLVTVSNEVVFRKVDHEKMIGMVRKHLAENEKITVAEARDLFSTSRRYVLALLENLDELGVTVREEDYRVLKS